MPEPDWFSHRCLKDLFVISFILITVMPVKALAGSVPSDTKKTTDGTQEINTVDIGTDLGNTMTRESGSGRFRVSMRSNVDPVPLSQIHSWTLHIETPEGNAIDDAQISVYGDMPAHRHGLPTRPRVTKNRGGGDYLIEGVKFTMPGQWQLILIITADGKRDKAKFNIELH